MVRSETHISINRPRAEVYASLMEVDNYLLWLGGLMAIEASNGMVAGSVIRFTSLAMGQQLALTGRVTQNDDGGTTFCVEHHQGPLRFVSRYVLEDEPRGTRLVMMNEIEAHPMFRLAEPVLQSMNDAKNQSDLEALRVILEHAV